MKRLLSGVCAFVIALSSNLIGASAEASAENIKKYIQPSAPDAVLLSSFLELTDKDGKTVSEFSDPELIHRFYDIKNDDTFTRQNVFADYSGDFSAELDDSNNYWIIPVIEDNKVIGEYDINAEYTESMKGAYSVVSGDLGVGMIYSDELLEEIFPSDKYGEPVEIKSAHISYPSGAFFAYIKTKSDEYIIPFEDVKLGSYDDNDNYSRSLVFSRLNVYTADEWVEAFKIALKDRIRHDLEVNEKRGQGGAQYVDKNGDFATTAPKPAVMPTAKPTDIHIETVTAAPTEKSTQQATEEPALQPQQTDEPKKVDTINVKAGEIITVEVNGETVSFPDARPFIDDNDRTLVPIRAVAETLGCSVEWNENTQTAAITHGDKVIFITIGNNILQAGSEIITMDTTAVIKDERTYIPIRFIGEALRMTVNWIK